MIYTALRNHTPRQPVAAFASAERAFRGYPNFRMPANTRGPYVPTARLPLAEQQRLAGLADAIDGQRMSGGVTPPRGLGPAVGVMGALGALGLALEVFDLANQVGGVGPTLQPGGLVANGLTDIGSFNFTSNKPLVAQGGPMSDVNGTVIAYGVQHTDPRITGTSGTARLGFEWSNTSWKKPAPPPKTFGLSYQNLTVKPGKVLSVFDEVRVHTSGYPHDHYHRSTGRWLANDTAANVTAHIAQPGWFYPAVGSPIVPATMPIVLLDTFPAVYPRLRTRADRDLDLRALTSVEIDLSLAPPAVVVRPGREAKPPRGTREKKAAGRGKSAAVIAGLVFWTWEHVQDWRDWLGILTRNSSAPKGMDTLEQLAWWMQNPEEIVSVDWVSVGWDAAAWYIDESIGAFAGQVITASSRMRGDTIHMKDGVSFAYTPPNSGPSLGYQLTGWLRGA